MVSARQIVDPPAFTPLRFGLMSAVQLQSPADKHWQNGVTFQTRCAPASSGATTYDECIVVTGTGAAVGAAAPPAPPTKSVTVQSGLRGAQPFTVVAEFDCSVVGLNDAAIAGRDALDRTESWQVERAFWTGVAGGRTVVYPHLASSTAVVDAQSILLQSPIVTGGGAFKPARALGVLEGLISDCYNGAGLIHVPQFALPLFMGANGNGSIGYSYGAGSFGAGGYGGGGTGQSDDAGGSVSVDAQNVRLRTVNGNAVAVGGGYSGTSPLGQDPTAGTTWIYGTGPVMMYRGDVRVTTPRDSIDRAENTYRMIAERTYLLAWECCHFGVLVDLT